MFQSSTQIMSTGNVSIKFYKESFRKKGEDMRIKLVDLPVLCWRCGVCQCGRDSEYERPRGKLFWNSELTFFALVAALLGEREGERKYVNEVISFSQPAERIIDGVTVEKEEERKSHLDYSAFGDETIYELVLSFSSTLLLPFFFFISSHCLRIHASEVVASSREYAHNYSVIVHRINMTMRSLSPLNYSESEQQRWKRRKTQNSLRMLTSSLNAH